MNRYRQSYEYYRELFRGRTLPLAFVDMDVLDENIRRIRERAQGKHIRIASKSIRCDALLRYILAQGAPFRGIMTYHPAETYRLSRAGFDDLLLGYPTTQIPRIEKLTEEIAAGKRIRLMADSEYHLSLINAAAEKQGVTVPVCIDLDMSVAFPGLYFGVYRSPLKTPATLRRFLEKAAAFPHVCPDAIMGYEAQIAGVGDKIPGGGIKNSIIRGLKTLSRKAVARRREEFLAICREHGLNITLVNGGGTGSMQSTGKEGPITEITVGSGFYAPGLFDHYRGFRFPPAAGFALEISRIPQPGIYTCHMGGYIASGATGRIKQPVAWLPEGLLPVKNEGFGEVQTPLRYSGNTTLAAGDPLFFRHAKAGELMEHFPEIYLVRNGDIEKTVKTYRGENEHDTGNRAD